MNEASKIAVAEMPAFDRKLKRQTLRSIFWTMGQTAGDQVFSFFVFVMLARLLDKPAIGTFAIAFVFVDVGRNFATAGVSQRVARMQTLSDRELDTIFWTNTFLAMAYALLLVIAAPAAERLFGAPHLSAVLIWLAITVVLSGAGNTHMALRLREFGHKTLAYRSVLAGLIGGVCAVVAALLGAGIWALVLQRIVRELICTITAWSSYRWRPGLAFDLAEARKYLKNSIDLGLAQVVTLLSFRAQDLGIGRVLGPAVLSSYRVAWRCAELIGPQIVGPFGSVALQTFSRLQNQPEHLREAYKSMLQQCALVSVPALVGYAIAGPWIVPVLFGPQWRDAGTIAPMLLPLALPFTLSGFMLALLASKGRIKWQRHFALLDLTTTILVTAITVSHGLKWVALGYSLRAVMLMPLQLYLIRRVSGIGLRDHVEALAKPVLAASLMGITAASLFYLLNPTKLTMIALLCGSAAALYASIVAVILPQYRRRVLQLASL